MPARKPASLITRHETAAEKQARAKRESGMRPERGLPMGAPAQLRGHLAAESVWRRAMRTYGELAKEIVTRLDQDLLCDYCILMEQLAEMDEMRHGAAVMHGLILARMGQIKGQRKELAKAVREMGAPKRGEELEEVESRAAKVAELKAQDEGLADLHLELALKLQGAFDSILKLDARVDLKRSKLHTLRQSLYLTPRSRAGTAPAAKEEEEAPDEMEKLLNDAGIFVATGKQDEGR